MEGASVALLVILAGCYVIPTIVALFRGKVGVGGVIVVNILLGWTVVGWFVSFIWACSGKTSAEDALDAKRHHEMMLMLSKK